MLNAYFDYFSALMPDLRIYKKQFSAEPRHIGNAQKIAIGIKWIQSHDNSVVREGVFLAIKYVELVEDFLHKNGNIRRDELERAVDYVFVGYTNKMPLLQTQVFIFVLSVFWIRYPALIEKNDIDLPEYIGSTILPKI